MTSLSCNNGGEIFSVSGNLKVSVSSTSGGVSSGSYHLVVSVSSNLPKENFSDLLENLNFRLCLSCTIGVIPPSINEGLQVFAVLHLCLVFFFEVPISFSLGRVELGEVSIRRGCDQVTLWKDAAILPFVVVKTCRVHVNDVGGHSIPIERSVTEGTCLTASLLTRMHGREIYASLVSEIPRNRQRCNTYTTKSVPFQV